MTRLLQANGDPASKEVGVQYRLSDLEAVRGTARVTQADEAPFGVRATWPCGCVATGPSFEALSVQDLACLIHRAERSQTTLVFRPNDLP